ncbi:sugar ABC transporter substrate-binding protein [Paenibacillus sp. FJAT-27812]|uniref:sugar ABC transporter substrate-binding protein n=1 Tax=Paenibacillus sp. FJAT-27812 TaxID=1684143 RepID=UPI0006A787C5|nr:sugar ABC transporter substrate-binding protein [Paenibacillus sp. FJAT-27812]
MKTGKGIKSLTLVLAMVLTMATVSACGGNTQNTADSAGSNGTKKHVFAASYFTLNNPHFIDWSKGLKSEIVDKHGDKLIEVDAQLDINKQISDVEDFIQQKVDAIFIAPVDSKGIKTALISAQKANIPVIIMDVPPQDIELITALVTTDNFMAGKVLGEAMVKNTDGKANVAIIDWSVVQAVVDRTDGFSAAVKDAPGIKVVARQDGKASTESALPIMENFLQSNPEINTVFTINDPSAVGALAAIEAAKRTDIKIYSIDGSQDVLKLIQDKKIVGTSAQFPVKMGEVAGALVYKILNKESFEKWVKVESVFVDESNLQQYLK